LLPAAAAPSLLHTWFVGPDGLRAGWRFLLYAALWEAALFLLGRLLHLARPQGLPGIWEEFGEESQRLLAAVLAALVVMRVEKPRRPFGAFGLPGRSAFGKHFWAGTLWGIAALTVLMLGIRGFGDFTFGGLALHGVRALKFAAFWGFFFLVVAFFEEFLFRGYPQFTLTRGMGFWPAALLLSFIFGATHLGNNHESGIGALTAGLIGLFFCLTLRRTGALWFAVGFHTSWDWGESYLYSIPDSGELSPGHLLNSSFHGTRWITGGEVGPEGSVLVLVVIALMWVVFDRVYPRSSLGASYHE
jgi:membrane protease YdiL (CAAX protease family)